MFIDKGLLLKDGSFGFGFTVWKILSALFAVEKSISARTQHMAALDIRFDTISHSLNLLKVILHFNALRLHI